MDPLGLFLDLALSLCSGQFSYRLYCQGLTFIFLDLHQGGCNKYKNVPSHPVQNLNACINTVQIDIPPHHLKYPNYLKNLSHEIVGP